jgi:putative tricarboxylic transport membrane protein
MRLADRFTGLFLVGLGALAAYGGSRLPPVPGQPVGPNVFPMVVGIGLSVCGLMIAIGIGHHFEEEAEADLAAHTTHSPEEDVPHHPIWYLRALIPPALLLFYVFTVDRIGFVPTAAIMVVVTAVTLGASLRLAIPLALLAPVGVHLIFYKLLRVPLPDGWLPMPWS